MAAYREQDANQVSVSSVTPQGTSGVQAGLLSASPHEIFGWSVFVFLATMDISAHAVSLADRPQLAIWVTSVGMRREDDPPSRFILSQTSAPPF
jgi:hypothetical protein